MKLINVFITLSVVLLFISGCSLQEPKEKNTVKDIQRHSVFNLDPESINDLDKGVLRGTPLKLDRDLKMSDIEKVWGKPNKHRDLEDQQFYGYTIKNQSFYIYEDEMNEISMIEVDLNYSKDEILKLMGKPTKPGHIFIYEKENHVIQFEKFNDKWRLILRY
ncbi:hypothetical protein [Bacillus massilinigeriensis]|uniref:hypothetical protein n=1 Tax=Bacillus massilionigeriensis TaxID=1805475 RepID=UPI00096AEEB2|nr:hypothetical protein [Bacillus massilionigeriensis]